MLMMFLRMKINESNMTRKEKNLRILVSQVRAQVPIQIRIPIIINKALKNVLIKMMEISMVISKLRMISFVIIQASTPAIVSFGKKLRDNNNKAKKNLIKRKTSGKIDNKKNKMIPMRNGMEAIHNKKKISTNSIWKEICMDGVRIITSNLKVHLIPMIKNIMITSRYSIELSFMERRYFQRRRRIMVSTHPKRTQISIKRTVAPMHAQIYLIINI